MKKKIYNLKIKSWKIFKKVFLGWGCDATVHETSFINMTYFLLTDIQLQIHLAKRPSWICRGQIMNLILKLFVENKQQSGNILSSVVKYIYVTMEHWNLNPLFPQILRKRRFIELKFATEFPIFASILSKKMINSPWRMVISHA